MYSVTLFVHCRNKVQQELSDNKEYLYLLNRDVFLLVIVYHHPESSLGDLTGVLLSALFSVCHSVVFKS